jgi:anti-sigma regulatory factor (Ser/Thr protein kinase)
MPGSARPRHHEHEGSEEHLVDLPGHRRDVQQARMVARRFLDGRVGPSVCEEVVLLVSELVTNAVVHARTEVRLRLRIDRTLLRVEVEDCDERVPVARHATLRDERGRGLRLVEQYTARWGVTPWNGGKTVWFEVDV